MHTLETVLVFVGIPATVVAVITGLVFAGSASRNRRYRPGRPFTFTPVWFLSAPAAEDPAAPDGAAPAVTAAVERPALPAAPAAADVAGTDGEWPVRDRTGLNVTGGASDRW